MCAIPCNLWVKFYTDAAFADPNNSSAFTVLKYVREYKYMFENSKVIQICNITSNIHPYNIKQLFKNFQ